MDLEKKETEYNKTNLGAIQGTQHDSNYVVIDKKNHNLRVFDMNNKLLYQTDKIITGGSRNDYNTITYVDKNGEIKEGLGNESTPAGVTVISGVGMYHGAPSFTRSRVDSSGKAKTHQGKSDDIASSFHYGLITEDRRERGSNGCVRIDTSVLKKLPNYIGVGTKVYTLPEKEGSRFVVRNGRLNFVADHPYGETKGSKKYWDDYNTSVDTTYTPLTIKAKQSSGSETKDNNIRLYANVLSSQKAQLMKEFNLDSYTYDKLAQLAMGIAEQETKFGTSRRKQVKNIMSDDSKRVVRQIKNDLKENPALVLNPLALSISAVKGIIEDKPISRGITQIKMRGDNTAMQKFYKQNGLTEDNVDMNVGNSALATIGRLAEMYNSEVRGKHFKGVNNSTVNSWDALLYKWLGRNSELTHHMATPEHNEYIRNIKRYLKNFSYMTEI